MSAGRHLTSLVLVWRPLEGQSVVRLSIEYDAGVDIDQPYRRHIIVRFLALEAAGCQHDLPKPRSS